MNTQAKEKRREIAKLTFSIFLPVFISTFLFIFTRRIPLQILLIPLPSFPATSGIYWCSLSLTILSGIYWKFQSRIDDFLWRCKQKRLLEKPKFGILRVENCESKFTDFKPNEWRRALEREGFEVEYISPSGIGRKYTVIINPYGEVYPEESIIELETFKRIKQFIADGGVFVSAGGLPFFWAYSMEAERSNPLSEPVRGLAGRISRKGKIFLHKPFLTGGYRLFGTTLLYKHFHLYTTFGGSEKRKIYQKEKDKERAGSLVKAGGAGYIDEFRAIREPAGGFLPFLRAKIIRKGRNGEERKMSIYPLGATPYGRGYLITTGMNLASKKTHKGYKLCRIGFHKVISGVKSFVNYLRYQIWRS